MEEKIKDLNERVRKLEEIDGCNYDFFVSNQYIQIPISLFMRGIMDDKSNLVSQIQFLKKELEKCKEEKETITKAFLLQVKKSNSKEGEEIEIL